MPNWKSETDDERLERVEGVSRQGDNQAHQRAMEACRQTRDDAARLLASITDYGDTYFDRSDTAADVDVTDEHIGFFQTVIDRMDIALAALDDRRA